ncbi:F-box/kelch-repeat protein SKIP6 [Morus notabilis]|uniref:F-box/kelch-repeat protein SKIP6 n=1 Tax=Morus notabilis TaxID=981085 RepID=W9S014_9ROSA|nr:F-box/kelch-repeat protein SKIP6 [Morus notabilis]EXC19724.1 F-box/kelch-repeat protein SKIP6 [Morus notabilis]
MSTVTEALPEILIPSLPNDVALQCLARVPRRYHRVLAAVSKPIRSVLSSPHFFAVRSSLNCTELLPYLRIRSRYCHTVGWFTVFGRRPDDGKNDIIVAPVPGDPNDRLDWSNYAAVGPKIYVVGGISGDCYSTELWIFDCRFHTWERGPSMPTVQRCAAKTVVLDGKIYAIGCWTEENSWVNVFDTVDGRWEALPSPKLRVYGKEVDGCAIRGGKVCVWSEFEELKFDPATKTWEVFRSGVGSGLRWTTQICEVNGMLYCTENYKGMIKGFDERNGVWKEVKIVDNTGLLPNHLWKPWMVNVGGRLVIMGWKELQDQIVNPELDDKVGVWCAEIEVEKDGDGDFRGEVQWSEMVSSMRTWLADRAPLFYACVPVSY